MKKIILSIIISIASLSVHAVSQSALDIMEYERLGRQGNAEMQFKLGLINEFGIDARKDQEAAEKWYKRASNNKFLRATVRLGVINYDRGDYEEAMGYFDQITDKTEEPIVLIYYGLNERRNKRVDSAQEYFKEAIAVDYNRGYYELGVLYAEDKENYYIGFFNTKISEIKGYKPASAKSIEYKRKLSSNQLYSVNDRIKRFNKNNKK